MSPAGMPQTSTMVEVTPFALLYDLDDGLGIPSSEDFGMAIDITMGYLNTYMSLQYEGQGLTDFETAATATIYRDGIPQIDFEATATFDGDRAPRVSTLDNSVAQAFVGANLALYLSMLQNLPQDNAFHTVSGARMTNPTPEARAGLIGSISTAGKAGIAGAIGAGGLIVFAIGFLILQNENKPRKPMMPGIGSGRTRMGPSRNKSVGKHQILARDEQSTQCEATTASSAMESTRSRFFPSNPFGSAAKRIPVPQRKDVPKSQMDPLQSKRPKRPPLHDPLRQPAMQEEIASATEHDDSITTYSDLG